jgi:hypothetical protein
MSHTSRLKAAAGALALATAIATMPVAALAAPSGGDVRITLSAWNPATPTAAPVATTSTFPALLLTAFNGAFTSQAPTICAAVKAQLTAANGMGSGFTAHPQNFVCNPGSTPSSVALSMQGNAYTIAYTITGNYLELTTTTPTALGAYADPRFSVTFNMTLNVTMPVPSTSAPLAVNSMTVTFSQGQVDSHNLAADVVKALAGVVAFFDGPNFQYEAQKAIDSASVNLTSTANAALAKINLAAVVGPSYTQVSGSLPTGSDGPIMALTFAKPIDVPTHGTATLPVTVQWTYGTGAPAGGCAALSAKATVQVGPPAAGSPMSATGNPGVGSGIPKQTGEWQKCTFDVTYLPSGIPINLAAAISGGWNSAKYVITGLATIGEVPAVETLSSAPATPVVFQLGVRLVNPTADLNASAPGPNKP